MRFQRSLFYALTIFFTILGLVLVLTGNFIFEQPYSFQSTREERAEFYPSTWYFSSSFKTSREIIDMKGGVNTFESSTTHSFTVGFTIDIYSANWLKITFNPITTDSRGYGSYWFILRVADLESYTIHAIIADFTTTTSVIVPEAAGYRFLVSGEYYYLRCVSGTEFTCVTSILDTEEFSNSAILDLDSHIWKQYSKAYINLIATICLTAIFIIFTIEYSLNFKDRTKTFKWITGISYGANVIVFIYSLVYVFITIAGGTIAGLIAPKISILVTALLHLIINFSEWQYAKYDQSGE